MNTNTDHHDPYVLYVRAYRQHPDRWNGNEPPCAKGQLAIALGREDAKIMGTGLKTRAAFVLEMDRYNAEPIERFSSRARRAPVRARVIRSRRNDFSLARVE